ncbi:MULTISPECIES: hypothetical protein [Streptomyces]|uniref:Uncharacterized protein n=1 Tax=Streptomyces capitiformicae TaxID=2014920 RepID=A0A919GF11_9ACTN|nr:hypothetical protein [Streptomyces capitiformicae]GHH82831.1 hypothetical protein GCM10017771_08110 [Streptomyces capitiformicae]
MHPQNPYEITTLPPLTVSGPARPVVLRPEDIPPGVQWVTLANGLQTLAYTEPPAPAPAAPAPAAAPIPAWAKTTALLAPTVGGGIAAAGIGLSYAAPGLIAMTHALWSAAALVVAAVVAVPVLIRVARGRDTAAPARITQNITATGLFGKATGTINHR